MVDEALESCRISKGGMPSLSGEAFAGPETTLCVKKASKIAASLVYMISISSLVYILYILYRGRRVRNAKIGAFRPGACHAAMAHKIGTIQRILTC